MNRFVPFRALFAASFLLVASPVSAFDYIMTGNVTQIEASYMPSQLPFYLNVGGGACPAGAALIWTPNTSDPTLRAQSNQSILAVLMTALAAKRTVTVYGINDQCHVQYIYLN